MSRQLWVCASCVTRKMLAYHLLVPNNSIYPLMTFKLNHTHPLQDFWLYSHGPNMNCVVFEIFGRVNISTGFCAVFMRNDIFALLLLWRFDYFLIVCLPLCICNSVHALVCGNVACYNLKQSFSATHCFQKGSRDFESYQNALCDLYPVNVWVLSNSSWCLTL